MTLEQIRIFVEAAQYGSFTVAAEKLGLTQSAVSISIKKIEEKYNVVLFDRGGRRLLLTEAGQVLLSEGERILRDVELTIRRVESRREGAGRYPIVACTANAYDNWMPGIVARVHGDEMPRIDLLRGTADEVNAWVMRGTADVGVTEIMPSHPQFRHLCIFRDQIILCATLTWANALPELFGWPSLASVGHVIWEQGEIHALVTEASQKNKIDLRRVQHPYLRLTSASAVHSMAESGRFPAFVSRAAAKSSIAAKLLVQVGRITIPAKYWMFALRDRDIEPLASLLSQAAHNLEKTFAVNG
jgi:DNA-binding transcriptional LysR family regulator